MGSPQELGNHTIAVKNSHPEVFWKHSNQIHQLLDKGIPSYPQFRTEIFKAMTEELKQARDGPTAGMTYLLAKLRNQKFMDLLFNCAYNENGCLLGCSVM
jgi:hypothetical protein